MFANVHSFHGGRLGFRDALEAHPMLLPVVKSFMEARFPTLVLAVDCVHLVELWEGLQGLKSYTNCKTRVAQAVDMTIPPEYVQPIRGLGGVTTAYAFCELAKALQGVKDLKSDLDVRDAFVAGWSEFEKRRQAANAVQEGYGCNEAQSWQTLRDIDDESSDADLLQKITEICKLAWRMYEHFGYQRKDHPNEDPLEVEGVRLGGNVDRVLPTELAMLGDEELADAQAMKILTDSAPVLEMKGHEERRRGPLVLVIDESGSMHDGRPDRFSWYQPTHYKLFHGRNTWAKAAAVALTRIAWQEGRAVKAVHFGTATVTQDVPKDDIRALFEMSRSFLSGGTSFVGALHTGQKMVTMLEDEGLQGADIFLVTDGEEYDYQGQTRELDKMDEREIKLWTVAVGVSIPKEAPVRARAEHYTEATDSQLGDDDYAVQLATGFDRAAMDNKNDWGPN